MTLTFLGAARVVTGSKHLLQVGHIRVLVDCGLFQGLKSLRERNWESFPVPAASIDVVVLTHAHLDHCGYLPRLVSQGFTGRVYCTGSTAQLAKIVMSDAARIQEEDAERANRKGYTKHRPATPLFTEVDAAAAILQLQPIGYDRPMPIAPGIELEFTNAGHLLGSAYARISVASEGKTVLFGGDLGRYDRPVLPDPVDPPDADIVLVESTYGDRVHAPDDGGAHLAKIINETVDQKGKIVIPSFALGRVEELLYWVRYLEEKKAIPELPVYVDSPMAVEALAEYRDFSHELDEDLRNFLTARLRVVSTIAESQKIQEDSRPSIVISSSGMATGGRVLHHLKRALPDERNTVLFAGYQAQGTRGRLLKEGAQTTRIHGQEVVVKARIETLDGTSAHADSDEIMRWLKRFKKAPSLLCMVHGEPRPMDALKARVERELQWNVRTPGHREKIDI
ncbi:MAG: MBL fold metallo-hydrolase [Acidobacteria bacterium]|jgi:metallo-beta-lactamase family protein|nr:MBL fold metallo-hydrolase [Acidobacteriota bacterium]